MIKNLRKREIENFLSLIKITHKITTLNIINDERLNAFQEQSKDIHTYHYSTYSAIQLVQLVPACTLRQEKEI